MDSAQILNTQKALSRVRAAMDLSPFAIYLVDRSSLRFVDVNTAACTLTGYSREQLLQKGPKDLRHVGDAGLERAYDAAIAAGRKGCDAESVIRTGDGRELVTEEHQGALFVDGRWIVITLARDITARKRAEQALRESEERFRLLVQGITDCAIIMLDAAGNVVSWNTGARRMLGYLPVEVVGGHCSHFFTERDIESGKPAAELRTAAALGKFEGTSLRVRKNGSEFWASVVTTATRDSAGTLSGFSTVMLDISASRWSEAALRVSERKFAKAFHGSSDLITLSRLDSGEILEANAGFERLTGYARGEAVGRTTTDLRLWESPQQGAALAAQLATGEPTYDMETTLRRKDGTQRTVILWLDAVELGDERCILTIGRDVSEQRQMQRERALLEAQLHESQKMEALGTLAGGVAHDFSNALAIIAGNLELVRQDLPPSHPALQSLEEISKASQRAKRLVLQILTFARRERLERKAVPLTPVVEESVRLLRATLPADVTLHHACDAGTPIVLADAAQVEQVLLNLCSNAWQAARVPGRPRVIDVALSPYEHAGGQTHPGLKPGRYACLSVRDNGPGMDEATRHRIFEPFFTTKQVGEGTGLGLSVVLGIVQAHEGCILLDTTPGAGSVFRIYLPAFDAAAGSAAPSEQGQAAVRGNGEHLLYVDDEEALTSMTKKLLERQGYRVSTYTDPRAALADVQANPAQYDVVITDYNMPGMSGLELTQALRQIRPDLPLVMISGYVSDALQADASAAGIRELIYKPDTVEALSKAVARAAESLHRPREPSGSTLA